MVKLLIVILHGKYGIDLYGAIC